MDNISLFIFILFFKCSRHQIHSHDKSSVYFLMAVAGNWWQCIVYIKYRRTTVVKLEKKKVLSFCYGRLHEYSWRRCALLRHDCRTTKSRCSSTPGTTTVKRAKSFSIIFRTLDKVTSVSQVFSVRSLKPVTPTQNSWRAFCVLSPKQKYLCQRERRLKLDMLPVAVFG